MKKAIAGLMILCLMGGAALADTISFSGRVEASATTEIYTPVGGTVEELAVKAGQKVNADTVIARIRTTKVYATEDGTVTAVDGEPGDDAKTLADKYGAVMYMEGNGIYSIYATTSKDYASKEEDAVHPGETVYVQSRSRSDSHGEALVTTVDSAGFTVLVSSGLYAVGDSCVIYRDSSTASASRIGQGTVSKIAPTAVTGTGSIVRYAVQAGETVKRGQLLFETVDGGFDGLEMTGTEIRAGIEGTIAKLNVEQGGSIARDSIVAVIYPKDAVWVVANVAEADLEDLEIGQTVKVEMDWNLDQGISYEGRVEMISALGSVGEAGTTYPVYISFTPDENTRYSMTAVVSTIDEAEGEAAALSETASEANAETAPEQNEAVEEQQNRRPGRERDASGDGGDSRRRNRPDSNSTGNSDPENRPELTPDAQKEAENRPDSKD